MREFFIGVLLSTLWVVNLNAQPANRLSGRVLDESGAGLTGANVYIPRLERGTVSDTGGGFLIPGLPEGRFLLRVSFIGYETFTRMVSTGSTLPDIHLKPSTIRGDEVVISGGRHSTQHHNAIKIELMQPIELLESGKAGLVDALSILPGVDLVSGGGCRVNPGHQGIINVKYPPAQ